MVFKKYYFLIFAIVAFCLLLPEKAAAATYYLHSDHLGSTSVITKGGVVVEQSKYYPYGSQRQRTPVDTTLITEKGYTGQISDQSQTGLLYYNARYYDPLTAKFTQADIVWDNPNRYSYVTNNPISNTDKSGNCDDDNILCRLFNFPNSRVAQVMMDYILNPPRANKNLPAAPSTYMYGWIEEGGGFIIPEGVSSTTSLASVLGGQTLYQFDEEVGWLVMSPQDKTTESILSWVAGSIISDTPDAISMRRVEMALDWMSYNYIYDSTTRGDPYNLGDGTATMGNILNSSSMVCNENAAALYLLLGKMGIDSQIVNIELPGGFGHMGVRVFDPVTGAYYYVDPTFNSKSVWGEFLNIIDRVGGKIEVQGVERENQRHYNNVRNNLINTMNAGSGGGGGGPHLMM